MSSGGQHTQTWESGQRCSSCSLGQWCPALSSLLKKLVHGRAEHEDRVSAC